MASLAGAAGVAMTRSRAFWQQSESWASQRRASVTQFQGRAVQGRSDEIVRKEARWAVSAKRYLSGRNAGLLAAGFDGIRVDPKLYDQIAALMEGIAPRLAAAFDEHLAALAFKAWREWPVASGLSKSLLQLSYEVSQGGERYTGKVRSAAPYTVFIEGQPHRQLIDRPGREVAAKIAEQALDEIARGGA